MENEEREESSTTSDALASANQAAAEGHSIQAMDKWKQALVLDPDNAEAHLKLGVAFADAGELDRAVQELQAAYRVEPTNEDARRELLEALNERGVQANERGNREQAQADWQGALDVSPDDADAHYNLGTLLAESGDWDGAEEHLRAAIRSDPIDLETRFELASLLAERGREDAAISELREALSIGSRFNAAVINTPGALPLDAQFDGERFDRSSPLIQRMDERFAQIARSLAGLLLERGETDEASSALEQATFDKEAAPLWLQVGRGLIDKGRLDDAVLALRRAYQCDPTLAESRELLDQLGAPYQEPPDQEELDQEQDSGTDARAV